MTTIFTFSNADSQEISLEANNEKEAISELKNIIQERYPSLKDDNDIINSANNDDSDDSNDSDELEEIEEMKSLLNTKPIKKEMMDLKDLDKKYFLVEQNPLSTEANHEFMLETFGKDITKVQLTDPNHIWTILEGDDNLQYICPGCHYVNRIGYLQTLKPWKTEDECFLW